jgi:preprotein translocase subunit SecE
MAKNKSTNSKSSKKSSKKSSLAARYKAARKQAELKSSQPKSVEENLRPESRLARFVNRASNKASEVGEKELATPTPKSGVLGRRLDPFFPIKWLFRYLRDSYRELRRVTWPNRRTAWKLTGTVFLFSVIMALVLFGLDSLFNKLFELAFLKN